MLSPMFGSQATRRWLRAGALWRSLSFQAGAVLFLSLFVLLLLEVTHEWAAREAALINAERDTANLARSLVRHAESTIDLADSVLLGVAMRLEADGFSLENLAGVRQTIMAQVEELDRLRHVFVYDANGDWLISSLAGQPQGLNNTDRSYFQHHRTTMDPGPYIGPPVRSRSPNDAMFSRKHRDSAAPRLAGKVSLHAPTQFTRPDVSRPNRPAGYQFDLRSATPVDQIAALR